MPNQKICCQSTIHTSHAAITMRFTTLSCKTQWVLRMQLPQGAQSTLTQLAQELCTTAHKLLRFCSCKTRSRRQSRKTTILKRFERNFKRIKHQCQIKKFAAFSSFTRLTLPLQCDLRLSAAKRNDITHAAAARSNGSQIAAILQLPNRISTPKRKNDDFEAHFKRNFKRKIINAKSKNLLPKHHSHVSRCHYNAIYDSQLQNAIVLRMQLPQGATLTQPFHCDLQTLNCKTPAFVRGFLQIPRVARDLTPNEALVRGFLQIARVEEMKAKLSCEASFKFQELKRWKRRFRARLPSNSKRWRDENEAFVRGFLQIPRVEEMTTTFSSEASFNFQELKRWKRRFRARLPSNSKSWRDENDDFVRGFLQIARVEEMKAKLFVRGFFQLPRVEEMKTTISCEAYFKFQELKRWKRSSHARLPSNSKSWRDESEASCEASFKFQELKRWKRSFRARLPSNCKSWRGESEAFVRGFLQTPRVEEMKTTLSCEASFKFQKLKRWKRQFRARLPSTSKSWRDDNEAFVRGFLQIPRVEEMKTKLSWEASFKFQKLKRWKRQAFVRGFLQIPRVEEMKTTISCEASFKFPKVEDMKTKLSCEASFKLQELKRWKRSFRARLPSNSKRSRSDRISSV